MEQTLKSAFIEWIDSSSLGGEGAWKDIDEVKELKPTMAYACGFIISETKEHITIASHMHQHEVAGELAIPKIAISKVKRFSVKRSV